ncbi:2Fe-2S ferredoxin [Corynebacterium yudongzhengii]|uniref:2Fe-2S ferredoxin n=1 Tax=Corynebacterium yudongzhengii TaxID=2080740 RepID=A0A2U1T4B6_9CORY|nr:Rieske 2Fe-2S domain-containing protein [Corynebacterium yudongzhengii]AWB82857.1 2Fe-2S ferredoxin [Corynebacterium yudongzhengii]PWC00850.1 2Fe-2S ferredoxin [Corynebacterium yudongzhengii]
MAIHIGSSASLADGESLVVDKRDTGYEQNIAVFRDGEHLRAVDNTCTHLEASLANGRCEDGVITCWLHKATFDATTGEAIDYPARGRLTVHEVTEDDGELYLTVNDQ